jgi:hypothetical protein
MGLNMMNFECAIDFIKHLESISNISIIKYSVEANCLVNIELVFLPDVKIK